MAKAKKNQDDDSAGVDTLSEEETDATEATETDSTEDEADDTDAADRDSETDVDEDTGADTSTWSSRSDRSYDDSTSRDSKTESESAGSRPQPVPASSGGSSSNGRGGPTKEPEMRRAHLTLSRVEPWSVMKFSFVISLVCFIILFVAVAVIYVILSALGVFDAITELITSLTDGGEEDDLGLDPATWFSAARVLGYTGLWGAANIVLITALATFGSMLYNLAADLVGGLDVTLSESD